MSWAAIAAWLANSATDAATSLREVFMVQLRLSELYGLVCDRKFS
jgi:hypothetical protein